MIRASSAGIVGLTLIAAGAASLTIDARVSRSVVPLNGRSPVASSNSTMPNEKMSERAPVSRPSACSGDMYATVPMNDPARVSGSSRGADASVAGGLGSGSNRANPKSSSFFDAAIVAEHCLLPRLEIAVDDAGSVGCAHGVSERDGNLQQAA